MEMTALISAQDIFNNNEENTIHYDNVAYNLSQFVFPSIFYALRKSIRQQQQTQSFNVNISISDEKAAEDNGEKNNDNDAKDDCILKIKNAVNMIENSCDKFHLNLSNFENNIENDEEINTNQLMLCSKEQSFNLNNSSFSENRLNLNESIKNYDENLDNTKSSTENAVQIEGEINGVCENISDVLPDDYLDIENQFITLDFWCESKSEIKNCAPTDKKIIDKSNKQKEGRHIGEKCKANDTEDNFETGHIYVNTSKVTKYHHGDKGSNQQYSNVVRNYATSSNYRNCNSNSGYENQYNCRNRSDKENWTNFDSSANHRNKNKSNFRIVREQWQWNHNGSPDPHFNWTFRQSALVTKRHINEMNAIKRPSILSQKNNTRCNLPMNLLKDRINYFRQYCRNLESRVNYLRQRQRAIFQNVGYDRGDVEGRMDETLDELVRCRGTLGRQEEAQRDIAFMYGDMLLDGSGGMMSERHAFEVRQRWDRLEEYERIYGRVG